MDITKKCEVSGKYGFDPPGSNRYLIVEVEGKNGDLIKVNRVNGIRYNEIWAAYEHPKHEEHPIIDNKEKALILGGEERRSRRTICIVGK